MGLDNEMERIGRIIAADQGLEVRCEGARAFAMPGSVTIPSIEQFSSLGNDARRMLHGLLDHECGHALFSDFTALANWKTTRKPNATLVALQNYLEDGYVERMQGLRYVGCAENIARMNESLYARKNADGKSLMDRIHSGESTVAELLGAIGTVSTPHGGRTIEYYEVANPVIGACLRGVEPYFRRLASLTHPKATATVIELAEQMYAELRKPPEPKAAPGPAPNEAAGGSGDSTGSPPPPSQSEPADGDDTEPSVGVLDLDIGSALEEWSGEAETASTIINAELRDRLESGPASTRPYINFSSAYDYEVDLSGVEASDVSYAALTAEATAATHALVQAFEHGLKAYSVGAPVVGQDEGEPDVESLLLFSVGSMGADQIFTQPAEVVDARAVAVSILCDCSGSMGGTKAALCRQTAVAISNALGLCEVPHEVLGFSTATNHSRGSSHPWLSGHMDRFNTRMRAMGRALKNARDQGTDVSAFARELWGGDTLKVPTHAVLRGFGMPDGRGLTHIQAIEENLDGESVLWAARRLARRGEPRRILFVLSDGQPAGSHHHEQGRAYLREVVARAEQAGIEVYGLGIQTSAVADYYSKFWVVSDLSDLAHVALSGLLEVLTTNRREATRVDL